MIKKLYVFLILLTCLMPFKLAQAVPGPEVKSNDAACPDSGLLGAGMIKYICWDCVLPVVLFGNGVGGNPAMPEGRYTALGCQCQIGSSPIYSFGAATGLRPMAIVAEVVRNPHCSPLLGGNSGMFGQSLLYSSNKKVKTGDGSERQYYNVNTWKFPLLSMVEALLDKNCNGGSTLFSLVGVATLSPYWKCDECSFAFNPEAAMFANPFFIMLATMDGLGVTASPDGWGNKKLRDTWLSVVGSWGSSLYPLTGNVPHSSSPPQGTVLVAAKAIALEHRLGRARRTMGADGLCGGAIYPFLPKTQYKISQVFPFPQAKNQSPDPVLGPIPGAPPACGGNTGTPCPKGGPPRSPCCNQFGESTLRWNEWRNMPGFEDYIYLVFRWTDCCILYL